MADGFRRLRVTRKTGSETFHASGTALDFDLLGFWQWSTSDLVSNVTRGRLAEYIVAKALGVNTDGVRDEWAPFDLETGSGVKVEVKSAAYLQSWHQAGLSPITFLMRATRAWDPETNLLSDEARRQADVYVFALLCHKDKETVDPLDVDQWRFYVVPTAVLDARTRSQHSITLKTLAGICQSGVRFQELAAEVEGVAKELKR